MRKGIHPLLRRLTVVDTRGASSHLWSCVSVPRAALLLQSDPSTHPAWTLRKAAATNTGRVALYRQRFAVSRAEDAPPPPTTTPAAADA